MGDEKMHESVQWVELLDGTVRARMMTDPNPTEVMSRDRRAFSENVLPILRRVPWAPEHHWLFPWTSQRRLVFVAWVGRVLGLDSSSIKLVLQFVGWREACVSRVV